MREHGAGSRLMMILLSGLVLGALGLLEPLIRFWSRFHQVGLVWPVLIGLYLGAGLACAIGAAIPVTIGLATRAVERRPLVIASYYFSGTFSLAAVLILAPFVRGELASLLIPVSYAVIYPALFVLGALATGKLTPHLVTPVMAHLIGYPSGRISRARMVVYLIIIGLLIPVTAYQDFMDRYGLSGRAARGGLSSRPGDQPIQNLLLITVDGLRADHLGTYGYDRSTSPAIDSLASKAIVFERCFAQGNCTELSMGSLFTSLYPAMHSARHWRNMSSPLPDQIETLAENLRDAGLTTVGLMSNPFLKREWGLTQGFDRVAEFHDGFADLLPVRYLLRLGVMALPNPAPPTTYPRAEWVVDEAIRHLDRLHGHPFALYVHFMDTHRPFQPPESFETAFRTPGASLLDAETLWTNNWERFRMLPSEEEAVSQPDLRRFRDLYDASIRYVDTEIDRLLDYLDLIGLQHNTLIIITADHGAEFLEHGNMFHQSQLLYDELTHVPLICQVPGIRVPKRVPEIVRHIDLMPTLLELYDLPRSRGVQGQSLEPLLTDTGQWDAVPAFSQSYEYIGVRTPTHKLFYGLTEDDGHCFDLLTDPGETVDVYGEAPACDSLENVLMEFLRRINVPAAGARPFDSERPAADEERSLGQP